jgi:hypothetical protein
MISLHL